MSNKKASLSLLSSNLPSYLNLVEDREFKLYGRIQFEDDRAPSWSTTEGVLSVLNEDDTGISIQLNASPSQAATTIRYGLLPLANGTGGFLPFGLTLNSTTGFISGDMEDVVNPNEEPITFLEQDRPTWITESETWFYDEKETVNVSLSATPNAGSTLSYRIQEGNLPWGLSLLSNGTITGETQEVMFGEYDTYTESPPRWNTPFGTIVESDEFETVSYQLSASPSTDNPNSDISYKIVKGHLPWGLTLTPNGLISGTNTELYLKDTILPLEVFPKPKWVTAFGLIKKIKEKESVNIQLEATPQKGTTVQYRIVDGKLPWGMSLTNNGILSGTFGEVIYPELPDIVDENAPEINASTNVGSYNRGQTINYDFNISLYSGRTLRKVFLETGRLPLGVKIDNTGKVVGVPSPNAELKTYSFTVTVIDSADMRSSKVFTLTVY